MAAIADFRSLVHKMTALGAIVAVIVTIPAGNKAAFSREVRPAVWSGSFYPADPSGLTELIDRLTDQAAATMTALPADRPLRALIMPHAGYAYSGLTAAHAARALEGRHYLKVIIMGPDHRVGFRDNAISAVAAYETPLGRVPLSSDVGKLRGHDSLFGSSIASDEREHSIEVILPFLQSRLAAFEFIPIVMGKGSPTANAAAIEPLIGPETLVVISSDLSHFLPYDQAVNRDKQTLRAILEFDNGYLESRENIACGLSPILTLLELARRHRWQPVLLHYANSGDTAGDRSRVVGYGAIAFLGDPDVKDDDKIENRLSQTQGRVLATLARRTIAGKLGCPVRENDETAFSNALADPALQRPCGTFVTLKIDNRLRGCIGSLDSRDAIIEGVRRNALNAAFHDPRFAPLTLAELDRTDIEISVLTRPRPLAYTDAKDLISKLRVNIDGLIIRKGPSRATFLPQVWEQLPRPEDFLSHLCMKAGLASEAWRRGDIEVETYQVQYFEEQR